MLRIGAWALALAGTMGCSRVHARSVDTADGAGYEIDCAKAVGCAKQASKLCRGSYSVQGKKEPEESPDLRLHWTIACARDRAEPPEPPAQTAAPPPTGPREADGAEASQHLTSREIVQRSLPGLVLVETASGLGSGFCVSQGLVVTNVHVVAGEAAVNIRTHSGGTWPAQFVLGFDLAADIVLLAAPGIDSTPLPLERPGAVMPGDPVVALGAPKGLSETVSAGVVSAIRADDGVALLQHTAPISPGSSGGPVLDDRGRVIGVTRFLLKEGQNLNFASTVDPIRALMMAKGSGMGIAEFGAATKPQSEPSRQQASSGRPICGRTSFRSATAPEKTNAAACFGSFLKTSKCEYDFEGDQTLCGGERPFVVKWRETKNGTVGYFDGGHGVFLEVHQAESGEFVYRWTSNGSPAGACAFMGDVADWCFSAPRRE